MADCKEMLAEFGRSSAARYVVDLNARAGGELNAATNVRIDAETRPPEVTTTDDRMRTQLAEARQTAEAERTRDVRSFLQAVSRASDGSRKPGEPIPSPNQSAPSSRTFGGRAHQKRGPRRSRRSGVLPGAPIAERPGVHTSEASQGRDRGVALGLVTDAPHPSAPAMRHHTYALSTISEQRPLTHMPI